MNDERQAESTQELAQSARVLAMKLRAFRPNLERAVQTGIPGNVLTAPDGFFAAARSLQEELEALQRLVAPLIAKVKALPPIDTARLEAGREAIRQGDFWTYSDADDMARDLAVGLTLTAEEHLAFSQVLSETPTLTGSQQQLGAMTRGES